MFRRVKGTLLIVAASAICASACQSPTEPTDLDYIDVDAPSTVSASGPSGRTYIIPATDNEPRQVIEYPYVARFTVTLRMTDDAKNEDGALDFPVDVTATTATVSPASGGIVVPPPTGTQVYSEVVPFASGNRHAQSQAHGWFTDITPPRAVDSSSQRSSGSRKSIQPISPKQLA